ncbi:hypothetical protein WA026_002700 [Henosepilachna vigintioctopunctata]|uniref:Cytochrome P450 n=1 Tax=Henosepilachna vigintioctopunctata TaxID=420089 RepID=A0AAW1U0F7_9CUCU
MNYNNYCFFQQVVLEKRKQFEEKMRKQKNGEEICEDELKEKKTFLNLLLQLTHEGTKMTDDELRHEVDTFTIAGSDTTASTLSFCLVMLGMHPDLQEKIREEVIDILGEDRDVTPEDMSRLNLLERFIKETLRIFPVGPIVLRMTDHDINLGKHQIPAGCSLVLGLIRVHRDPRIWKDPLKFNPDRFLPEEVAKRHPYSYLPFSGGPRNCIGYKYAMMSMKTTLAMTLRKFVVMTEYKTIEEIRLRINIVLKPTDGYKVYVKLRE